ncbi:MAG: hypothetical protein HY472_01490 [Candidatus Sungbacteria bacterium]|nr:hypothetical protein [Candidatus Sungbacteria bacterium]
MELIRSLPEPTRRLLALGSTIVASFLVFALWSTTASWRVARLSVEVPRHEPEALPPLPETSAAGEQILSPAAGLNEFLHSVGAIARRAVTPAGQSASAAGRASAALDFIGARIAAAGSAAARALEQAFQREVNP